jgi:hypothetical protein
MAFRAALTHSGATRLDDQAPPTHPPMMRDGR